MSGLRPLGQREQVFYFPSARSTGRAFRIESLGPLGPTARGVTARDRHHRGAISDLPTPVERSVFSEASLCVRSTAGDRSLAFKV